MSKVKEMRTSKGYSQKRLASESGIGRRTLYDIEAGNTVPYWSTLVKLAQALDCDPHDIDDHPETRDNLKICVVCGKEYVDSPSNDTATCSRICSTINRQNLHKAGVYDNATKKAHAAAAALPYLRSTPEHISAKTWIIQAPDGQIYECRNLLLWLRDHADLLDGTPRQAWDGITKIKYSMQGKRKRKNYQWKGWTLLKWGD